MKKFNYKQKYLKKHKLIWIKKYINNLIKIKIIYLSIVIRFYKITHNKIFKNSRLYKKIVHT